MNYINTVQNVMWVLFAILGVMLTHFVIFAIVGIFKKKRYPRTEKQYKYGLIIPARNEENVVAGLIESIQKNNYPQDKLKIFVIAHNCSDRTAEIARSMGVDTYEYNNPQENTMGFAFRHLFSCIERDYGTQNFDGFFLFNADNILDKNYIARMNDAFDYYNKECVITSYRNSKNYGTNLMSGLYGMYFSIGCRLESAGRTVVGCSTRVQGTGYLINSAIVKNGWPYCTLAEDWEFSADQVLNDTRIRFCDDAIFYDEQPTTFKIMWRQRVRWSRGHLIVFMTRIKDLVRKIFSRTTKHRVSVYDITANVLPSTLFYLTLEIIRLILLLFAPLVDKSVTMHEVFFGTTSNLLFSNGLVFIWLRSVLTTFVSLFAGSLIVFFLDRKRIMNVSLPRKLLIALVCPFFMLIQLPMDVQALFSRKLGWKPIPHNDQTTFDSVNKADKPEE